jgi:superfamily II helicase
MASVILCCFCKHNIKNRTWSYASRRSGTHMEHRRVCSTCDTEELRADLKLQGFAIGRETYPRTNTLGIAR